MVGYAGSPTYTAYVDMTLTRSKAKVKVTGLLNFRQLAKPCMLAAMTAAPLRGFLVSYNCFEYQFKFSVLLSTSCRCVAQLPCKGSEEYSTDLLSDTHVFFRF